MIHASSSSMTGMNSQGRFHVHSRCAPRCDRVQFLCILTLAKDLKERYYSICVNLVKSRPGEEFAKAKILALLSFDKGTETTTILDFSSRNPERYLQKRRSYEKITSEPSRIVHQNKSRKRKPSISNLNVSNKLSDNSRRTETTFSERCLA